ncbi:MAG: Methyltransferase type 11 [Bryobacterales bacterium]|nr:Methyltransferase type 11 [Bryobacterales bacterium]
MAPSSSSVPFVTPLYPCKLPSSNLPPTQHHNDEAQSIAVKRAQVEFHNFASLGEPDRARRVYLEENERRRTVIAKHRDFIGELSPFLEIGANAGHSSYMLANEFGAAGFALDISADSLRHGVSLMDTWELSQAPVRVAGDALNLPFRDGSLRTVFAFQMLSQFMDIEAVFLEVKRVLAPGGVFIFAEEPLRRRWSLRLYRCPYRENMRPWEKLLHDNGFLGYFVRDVIGAHQEESFGIRQNHRLELRHWDALIRKHFVEYESEIFVPRRGLGETLAAKISGSQWSLAHRLGGTLSAMCRKEGVAAENASAPWESRLRCPDCSAALRVAEAETLRCTACDYAAANEGGVYNLLRSVDKKELYPGDRHDVIDFTLPGHEARLGTGWYALEGVYGNKYRWIGGQATATLRPATSGPKRLRIRGHASEHLFAQGSTPKAVATVNGAVVREWQIDRTGLFILEADVPDAAEYQVTIQITPAWKLPPDERELTVTLSMIRLTPRD